jgi:hypothetical protein
VELDPLALLVVHPLRQIAQIGRCSRPCAIAGRPVVEEREAIDPERIP